MPQDSNARTRIRTSFSASASTRVAAITDTLDTQVVRRLNENYTRHYYQESSDSAIDQSHVDVELDDLHRQLAKAKKDQAQLYNEVREYRRHRELQRRQVPLQNYSDHLQQLTEQLKQRRLNHQLQQQLQQQQLQQQLHQDLINLRNINPNQKENILNRRSNIHDRMAHIARVQISSDPRVYSRDMEFYPLMRGGGVDIELQPYNNFFENLTNDSSYYYIQFLIDIIINSHMCYLFYYNYNYILNKNKPMKCPTYAIHNYLLECWAIDMLKMMGNEYDKKDGQ